MSTSTRTRSYTSTERGRRTGVTVKDGIQRNANDRMEDPEDLFASALSPSNNNNSIESGKENNTKNNKEKKAIRFSLADEVANELQQASSQNHTVIATGHPALRLARGGGVTSATAQTMDGDTTVHTNDLSSVSTAALSESDIPTQAEDVDDMEETRNKQSQMETLSPGDFPVVDHELEINVDNDEDDDLVPPEPPHFDGSETDTEDERVEVSTQLQEENKSFHENSQSLPDGDFDNEDDIRAPDEEGNENDIDGVHEDDAETQEVMQEQRQRKKEKLGKARKKEKIAKTSAESSDDKSTPIIQKKITKMKGNRFATTFSPKGIPGPLTYHQVPASELRKGSPEDTNLRRSRRARTAPLAFWRNEKVVYGANDLDEEIFDGVTNMPMVVGYSLADPTPYKKRKISSAIPKKKVKKSRKGEAVYDSEDVEPFDSSKLRSRIEINNGKTAQLWDERYNDARNIKVVSYYSTAEERDLPRAKTRKKSEGKIVGKASQSFSMSNDDNPTFPSYIVGTLRLPPRGIKDAESVGLCAQVFTVVRGQPGSIEVAFGDPENESTIWNPEMAEHFLLEQGDNFLVPPGNTYRIENHSKIMDALLSWTIVRHNRNFTEESP